MSWVDLLHPIELHWIELNLQRFLQSLREMGQPQQAQTLVMGKVQAALSRDTSSTFRDLMAIEGYSHFQDTVTAREHAKTWVDKIADALEEVARAVINFFRDPFYKLGKLLDNPIRILEIISFAIPVIGWAAKAIRAGMSLFKGVTLFSRISAVRNFVRGASGVASSVRNFLHGTMVGRGLITVGKGLETMGVGVATGVGKIISPGVKLLEGVGGFLGTNRFGQMIGMGLFNTGIEALHQIPNKNWDWNRLLGAFVNGMVFGGVAGAFHRSTYSFTSSLGWGGLAGGLAGGTTTQLGELIHGRGFDIGKILIEGIGGAVGGRVGGRFLDTYGWSRRGLITGGYIGGLAGGGVGGGLMGGNETLKGGGSLGDILANMLRGGFQGAISGAALGGLFGRFAYHGAPMEGVGGRHPAGTSRRSGSGSEPETLSPATGKRSPRRMVFLE